MKWIDFGTLIDILYFALDNTYVLHNGKLLHQIAGIPMGGPMSPGMTIGNLRLDGTGMA